MDQHSQTTLQSSHMLILHVHAHFLPRDSTAIWESQPEWKFPCVLQRNAGIIKKPCLTLHQMQTTHPATGGWPCDPNGQATPKHTIHNQTYRNCHTDANNNITYLLNCTKETPVVAQLAKKWPSFHRTRWFTTVFTRARRLRKFSSHRHAYFSKTHHSITCPS
jgi:hypothetical protein